MSGALTAMLGMGSGKITRVTGATIDDAAGVQAGIRFNADGTTDKLENATYTQINGSSDWIYPPPPGSIAVEIHCDVISGSVTGDSTGVWLSLSASQAREWKCLGPAGAASITITLRNLAGTQIAQGSYTLTAVAP
jgi:hypothetical protein